MVNITVETCTVVDLQQPKLSVHQVSLYYPHRHNALVVGRAQD
jgi:hypothetical protein